ncbi:hypothetical protein C0J52_15524 [Blattella germanica]|nr:hypothetical protein C0J52_15524 [Blattella germanica]
MKPLSIFVGKCTDTTADYRHIKNHMRYRSGNVIHRKSMSMTNAKLYGPFLFSERSITVNIYLNMLELVLEPQLQEDGILDVVAFQ